MKTIGVITHWGSLDNYGQTLQAYALQKVLLEHNYSSFLIRYKEDGIRKSYLQKLFSCLDPRFFYQALRNKRLNRFDYNNNLLNKRDLRKFLDKNVCQASIIYGREDLLASPPDADLFITGSDQVWNKLDRSYYLDFTDKKKIAYAASFGATEYTGGDLEELHLLLDSFSHITVREKGGIKICEQAGIKDVKVVPDPTLLLSGDHYKELATTTTSTKPYLLIYFLGNQTDFDIAKCYKFARDNGLEVKYIASQRQIDKYEKIYPSMEEWLGLIHDASFIVTNSFHGTALSVIFNAQFVSVPLVAKSKKMNDRLKTFLSRYSLDSRISSDIEILKETIDYSQVNELIAEDREFGIETLVQMIEK